MKSHSKICPAEILAGQEPRILIIGDSRHGKDTAARIMASHFGLSFASCSEFAAQAAVFPMVQDHYPDWQTCFADRHNHQAFWHHAIAAYNLRPGPTVVEQILVDHQICVGMRNRNEFEQARRLFDLVLWIDRSYCREREGPDSMQLYMDDADLVLDNNGPVELLERQIIGLAG